MRQLRLSYALRFGRDGWQSTARYRVSGAAWGLAITMLTAGSGVAQRLDIEEIVVTARSRQETLQQIPLAISAFTARDLENAGIQDLGDLALKTPGMEFNPRAGGGRQSGRIDSVIRLRGVYQSNLDHLQPTSLFIDGIYVLGSANSVGLQDLERVEVIKGPQSAFFGRNTFAGAVNYITKTPSLEDFETKLDFSIATYDKYDGNVLTSGPLVKGKLAYQVNARLYHRGGEWRATDGGELGRERTGFASGLLYGEPNDNLSFKLRAYYQLDDDGPPVVGVIRGTRADTCTGKTIQRLNEAGVRTTYMPREYICGAVPKFGYVEAGTNRTLLSVETSVRPPLFTQNRNGFVAATGAPIIGPQPDAIRNFLGGKNASTYLGKTVPELYEFGMKRRQIRFALNADYNFGSGYSAHFLGGFNDMRMNTLWDYDGTNDSVWYSVNPKYGVDWSVEGRVNSPEERKLRWLAGATYYDQDFRTGGGLLISSCFITCAVGPNIFTLPPTDGNLAKVWGVFGSVSYDIRDDLTLDIETRYLEDERTVAEATLSFTNTFKQVTPRVILSYRPSDDTTVYLQASRGALPGRTNSIVAVCSEDDFIVPYPDPKAGPNFGRPTTDSECKQIRAQSGEQNFRAATPSQKLDAAEIGVKQTLFDDRVRLNLTGWYYKWKNRPFGITIVWVRDAENPANRDRRPNAFPNNQGMTIPGSQELWGAEFESAAAVTANLDAQLNVSWTDNQFTEFFSTTYRRITGVTNYKGLKIERYPGWQGNLSTTYTDQLSDLWTWYVRADFQYQGKYWADPINLARADDYVLTHARVGLNRDNLRVEVFVRNVFQTRAWASAVTQSDITTLAFDFNTIRAVAVVPQEKRTFGFRTNLAF